VNASASATASTMLFGAYFANWAQYHPAPYTHTPTMLSPIAGSTNHFYYGFAYFCPPAGTSPMPYWATAPFGSCTDATEFSLMTVEPKDKEFISQMSAFKAQKPSLKVILSIGGWNFPSSFFSEMAASDASRAKFVSSAKAFLTANNLDGIDIDWEFPCSPPRDDAVKITCDKFRQTTDKGGNCPQDQASLLALAQDLRTALGSSSYISIASQAGEKNWVNMNLAAVTPFIDHWHVMTYDYTVGDIPDGALMSPNAPLYTPPAPATQMSIDYSVQGYLAAGVPASKIMLGIPFYGHSWYKPGLTDWQSFGNNGTVQGKCCGAFKSTYGAKPGKGSGQCGTLMFNELRAAGGQSYYDKTTESAIMYFEKASGDGYTEAGTWVAYNDETSIAAITDYAKKQKLAGVFIFDTSMDTVDFSSGTFTFELMKQIAAATGSGPAPGPGPTPGPAPPSPSPGCPGGSLANCISTCPSDPLPAYKACVAECAKRCP